MEYPPKNRSKLWLLQPYRKLFFVANGWWYPELLTRRRSRDPPEKVELTLICFAKGGQNKVLEYFTKEEMQFIWENVFGITKLISGTTGRRVARRVARMLGKDTQAPPKLEGRRPRVPSSASSDASETSSACSDGEINGEELKMVIAVRMDLQMGKGKIAAQCCHAAVRSYQKLCTPTGDSASDAYWDRVRDAWENGGQRKVVVKVPNEEVLNEVVAAGREAGLLVSTIRDAGRTQIAAGSKNRGSLRPRCWQWPERQLSTATVRHESLSPMVLTSRVAALDDAFGWLVDHLPTMRPLLCLIKGEYDSCIRRLCRSLEVAALAANRLDLVDVEMAVKLEHVRSQHDSVVEELKAQLEKLGARGKDMRELVGQKAEELKTKDSELERLRREKYRQHRQNYDLVKGHNRLMAELTATAEREQNVASECIRLSHEVKHHEQQARSTEEQIQVLNDKISSMVTAEVHSRLVEEKNVALRELEDIRKKYSSLSVEYKNLSRSYAAVSGKGHGQIPRPDGTDDGSICRPLTPRPVWEDAAGVVDWQLEAAEDSDICRPDEDDHDQPQSAAGADMMHLVASVSRMSSLSLGRTLLSELERREAEGLRIMHAYGGAAALLGCRILGHYKAILEAGPPTARSGLRPFQDIAGELQPWGEALNCNSLEYSGVHSSKGARQRTGHSACPMRKCEFATDEPPSSCRNMSLSTTSVWEFLYGVATIYASRQNHESTFVAAILKAVVKQSSIYTGSSGLLDRWNLAMAECLRNSSSSGTASTRTMKDTWEVLQSSLWSLVLSIMFVVRREVISMTGVTPLMLAMTMLIREEITVWALMDNCHLPRDICAAFDRGGCFRQAPLSLLVAPSVTSSLVCKNSYHGKTQIAGKTFSSMFQLEVQTHL
ncbi:Gluconate transport-inducing protein [Perkinsus olseni]|uniref:peptidyl-tRNA hydrolase n=1 Tax=Perkinsus olseni TaxID=32597 RepID=A0A7J6NX76_PEROL|nr:Gluconate transport-inducing protein [Perkinsus olseni]